MGDASIKCITSLVKMNLAPGSPLSFRKGSRSASFWAQLTPQNSGLRVKASKVVASAIYNVTTNPVHLPHASSGLSLWAVLPTPLQQGVPPEVIVWGLQAPAPQMAAGSHDQSQPHQQGQSIATGVALRSLPYLSFVHHCI